MLPKYRKRGYILDKLHRGFVNVCIATSLVSGSLIVYNIYHYIRYIRPLQRKMRLQSQEELLAEGRAIEDLPVEMLQ